MQTEFVVTLGESLYEVERPWGVPRRGLELGYVSAVTVDKAGCVYVCQRTDPPVVVFDPSGEYLRSWGSGVIADSHGICAAPDGRVLVVDRDAHQVLVFDAEGELLQSIGQRHRPRLQEPFNHPTGVAVAAGGDVLVADGYANASVHRFAADGELLASWGVPGRGPGQFMTPHAVAIDEQDRIIVADRDNDRVQVFDPEGRLSRGVGRFLPSDGRPCPRRRGLRDRSGSPPEHDRLGRRATRSVSTGPVHVSRDLR